MCFTICLISSNTECYFNKVVRAMRNFSNSDCVWEFTIPCWTFPLIPEINKVVSFVKVAIKVFINSCSSSCPFSPWAEAVIKPQGFSEKTVVETHHSMAFFKPEGMLKTYSGVQITTPSACSINALKAVISGGVLFTDNSGSKCGRDFNSLKTIQFSSFSEEATRNSTNCRFEEFSLALPIIAKMFNRSTGSKVQR